MIEPKWIEQGPGPTVGEGGDVSGAVQAIAADPANSNRVFIGTTNGGIWRTNNATASRPNWIPLTDYQSPSLSIQCIALSPLDNTYNTVFAGIGANSHGILPSNIQSGPLIGIIQTSDGGDTWNVVASNTFSNLVITRILPTAVVTATGQVIFVTAANPNQDGPGGGVFRSSDSGATWQQLSGSGTPANGLPDHSYQDIVQDPGNSQLLFTVTDNPPRLFKTTNQGNSWAEISNAAGLPNNKWCPVRMVASPSPDNSGVHWFYLLVQKVGVILSRDSGTTWDQLDPPPTGGTFAQSIAVSPNSPNIVFAVSDAPAHWRGDANAAAGSQWYQLDFANAGGTHPHTDNRDWVYSADPSLMYEANDGGIFRLHNPLSNSPSWDSAVGNLRVTEFISVAYGSVNHVIFGACQDNSIPQQTTPGGFDWTINEDSWGDGMRTGVDNHTTPGQSVHYSSQQNIFHLRRRTYTGPTTVTSDIGIPMIIDGAGGLGYNFVEGNLTPGNANDLGTIRWVQTWTINAVDGMRFLLGTDYLYESFNRGDLCTSLGGLSKNVNNDPIPANPVGSVTAYAYGHLLNPDVMYVGTSGNAGGKLLWVRTAGHGAPTFVDTYTAAGGGVPRDIALDPSDWRIAYVLDSSGKVWRTTDAGGSQANWTNLTGILSAVSSTLQTIVTVKPVASACFVIVGGLGGVFMAPDNHAKPVLPWRKFGDSLPNAIVCELHYDLTDDVLLAGTYGRGVWLLSDASAALVAKPTIDLQRPRTECGGIGFQENAQATLKVSIESGSELEPPLAYKWNVAGANVVGTDTGSSVTLQLAAGGNWVTVSVTISDLDGHQMTLTITEQIVSSALIRLHELFCRLIKYLVSWPPIPIINPLGPDPGPIDISQIQFTVTQMTAIEQEASAIASLATQILLTGLLANTSLEYHRLPVKRPEGDDDGLGG